MWTSKVILADDEELQHESSKTSGFMLEKDIDVYLIVRRDGVKTGSVRVSDHTAVNSLRRTISVHQTDASGKTVVNESFSLPKQ